MPSTAIDAELERARRRKFSRRCSRNVQYRLPNQVTSIATVTEIDLRAERPLEEVPVTEQRRDAGR